MLSVTGRVSGPHIRSQSAATFDFTTALPDGFIYSRNDTVATRRNAAGKLVSCASNAPRFDHTPAGHPLGLMIEGSVQNKLAVSNANPATTAGWTGGGDGAASFTVVTDPAAYLAAAGLDQICTAGKLYKLDNSGGSADAWVSSASTFGSTSVHTISAWLVTTNAAADLTRTGSSPAVLTITPGGTLERHSLTLTPAAAGDQMCIVARPGAIVYFILPQMELNNFASSVIVTTGSAATRQQDICTLDGLDTCPWWNSRMGYIAARYISAFDIGATQYVVCATDGANFNEAAGLRIDSSGYDIKAEIRSANTALAGGDTGTRHTAGKLTAAAIVWQPGQSVLSGQGDFDLRTFSGAPSGITRLNIGARNGGTSRLWGWIQQVRVAADPVAPAAKTACPGDTVIAAAGQSLAIGHFYAQVSLLDTGRQTFVNAIGAARPQDAVTLISGATGSSAACRTSNPSNYWWDSEAGAPGPALDTFYAAIASSGQVPTIILWAQGEEDSSQIPGLTTRAAYKQGLQSIFAHMRQRLGPIPVIIQRIGRRDSFANTGGIQSVREVQDEMIAENDWIIRGAEIYDAPLVDGIHPTADGYGVVAARMARCILSASGHALAGTAGPCITGATRSGTTLTVTIAHDNGTDFTPAAGISGFTYLDASLAPVTISAAVRSDPGTITLTLASAVPGTLYYGYDAMLSLSPASIVTDNAPVPMPLRTGRLAVT